MGASGREMNGRRFGRAQQMWVLIVVSLALLGAFLWIIGAMTFALWWRVMLAALVAPGISVGLFQLWLRPVLTRPDSPIKLPNHTAGGARSLSATDIRTA